MRKIALLIPVLFIISCTSNHSYFDDFRFDQNAILEISISSVDSPVDFELYSRHSFPMNEFNKREVINQDTTFIVSLPSNIYDLAFIRIGDDSYMNIFTIPNDTLKISLSLDGELNREDKISLEGSTSDIYRYYEAKRKNWMKTKGYDYYYDSTISLQSFTEKMDRNRISDLEFLSKYESENNLPAWFMDIEKNSILYLTAGSKLGIINYHRMAYNPDFQPPDDYYSFVDDIQINNPEAYLSSTYYGFLSSYHSRNAKVDEPGFINILQRTTETIALIESGNIKLDPRIEDVLLGTRLSLLYRDKYLTHSNFLQSDSILEISKTLFHNEDNYKIIKGYRDSQYTKLENLTILNPGDSAPSFYLSDQNGKFYRLSDFSGKVIYVNFWTTSCSPCLASIPEKNLLVEEFSDQPFELLNICLYSKPELWSSIIEDRDFAGTHLICKGNWSSRLRDQYLIQAFPQYALIDSEGKIITNKCEKPEDIVDQLRTMLY